MEEKIVKVAVIGLGSMGRGHVEVYKRLEREGKPVKMVAVCDIDPKKLSGESASELNLSDVGKDAVDYSAYRQYTSYDELFKKEKDLDYVDIVLPTYLHAPVSIKAMKKGFNVFCEKPMALNAAECKKMIETSVKTGKKLMLGQCLRFWGEYEYLKNCVSDGRYGNVISAYFFRGGGTPLWSFENWLLCREKGGGGLHDQHVHDVDMVQYLFGMPESLVTSGKIVYEGSGYDCCSTNYFYGDGKVVNVQNDWTINGEFGFDYNFRVNFEKGSVILKDGKLIVYPHEGEKFEPEFDKESAYYKEIVYFANCVRNDLPVEMSTPESCAKTIDIVCAEAKSADNNGKQIKLLK